MRPKLASICLVNHELRRGKVSRGDDGTAGDADDGKKHKSDTSLGGVTFVEECAVAENRPRGGWRGPRPERRTACPEAPAGQADPHTVAVLLVACIDGLVFDALITGRTNAPELAERAAAAILRASTVTS
jgi:hypothetical protein